MIKSSLIISNKYNRGERNPIDCEIIRVCEKLEAYLEASLSIACGIRSPQMDKGKHVMLEKY